MRNTRTQQYQKLYSHYIKSYLVHKVYNLGYYYDYDCELLEYSPNERCLDYATNHAHDVAKANNDYDDLLSLSKGYLYNSMIGLINATNSLINEYESEVL